jgi:ribulose-phosphate 3-epimerase
MVDNADSTIEWYIEAGADSITVHSEACPHLHRTLARIREAGRKAAVSLNPATPIDTIVEVIEMVDMVLVMSVNPGFGGQSFIERSVEKVAEIAWMAEQLGVEPLIQVDGGITVDTAPLVAEAGARCLVAGNAVYGQPDPAAAMNAIRDAAQGAL